MMKRTVIPLAIIALVALGLWGQERLTQRQSPSTAGAIDNTENKISSNTKSTSAQVNSEPALISAVKSQSDETKDLKSGNPKASLNEMSLVLVDAVRGSKKMEHVVQRLKQTGQNPLITRNANPATGEMLIIRTQNPLPGTRYFHAQYVTDENNQRFVQHMSFEFKPGPTSMSDAVHAAIQNFSVGEPSERKKDFVQWDLDDDYVLWIRKKSAEDLKFDPFNAQDPKKDVGTVQMTVELKIHDDGQTGHAH